VRHLDLHWHRERAFTSMISQSRDFEIIGDR
jgi:hypothetical protein